MIYNFPHAQPGDPRAKFLDSPETLKFIWESLIVAWTYLNLRGTKATLIESSFYHFFDLLSGWERNAALQHFAENCALEQTQINHIVKVFSATDGKGLAKNFFMAPPLTPRDPVAISAQIESLLSNVNAIMPLMNQPEGLK